MTRLIGKTEPQNEVEMKSSDPSCLRGRYTQSNIQKWEAFFFPFFFFLNIGLMNGRIPPSREKIQLLKRQMTRVVKYEQFRMKKNGGEAL